jgi:hypothetical protein
MLFCQLSVSESNIDWLRRESGVSLWIGRIQKSSTHSWGFDEMDRRRTGLMNAVLICSKLSGNVDAYFQPLL